LVFEPSAAHIWTAVAVATVLCALMVLALFVQSWRHNRTMARLRETEQCWRPWFDRSHFANVPTMQLPADQLRAAYVTQLWLDELLRVDPGSRGPSLDRAREAGVDAFVMRVLRRPGLRSPALLETCVTLSGLLRLSEAAPALKRLTRHRTAAVAFAASLALMRLAPQAADTVWNNAPSAKWSRAALLTLLKEVPGDRVDEFVQRCIEERPAKEAAQLLAAWAQLPGRGAAHYAARLLRDPNTEGWLLCAALRIQDDVTQSPQLRQYLDHPRWAVRLLALRAIAKLGYGQDLAALEKFRDSDNWWVRLRAREALAGLNGETR
jgi:hypothetical protein